MRRTTVATIQLLTVAAVVAVILLDASPTDYALCLAVLRLLNTWLRHTGRARARRRRYDEHGTT